MPVKRTNFRAFRPEYRGEDQVSNEQRFRAAVERAFNIGDQNALYLQQLVDGIVFVDPTAAHWRSPYVPGDPYITNDVVRDGPWLGIANKDTTDRLAPIPVGSPRYVLPDSPTWSSTPTASAAVLTGLRVTPPAGQLNRVTGYRFWAPSTSVNYTYEIWYVGLEDPSNPVFFRLLEVTGAQVTSGWNAFALDKGFVLPGGTFDIILRTVNSSSNTTFTGEWTRVANSQSGAPSTGQWLTNNQGTVLRVNITDNAAADRSTDLLTVGAGDTIEFTDTGDADFYAKFDVIGDADDQTTYIEYPVALAVVGPSGPPLPGNTTDLLATVASLAAATYNVLDDGTLTIAALDGLLATDGVYGTISETADAYGVDIQFQSYTVSPDWDIMAVTGI